MDDKDGDAIDARIAELEAELQLLKLRRTRQLGRQLKALDQVKILDLSRFIFGPFLGRPSGSASAAPLQTTHASTQ